MKVVIMAGGKGTRISEVNNLVPKPMIEINEKPILEYQIDYFKRNGFEDIILVVGYLKEAIINYFKDGKDYGVNINYIVEEEPLGTAGSFYYLKDYIKDEDFILVNGDIIFDIDMDKIVNYHKENKSLVTLCTHPNSHPYDSALIVTDNKGCVTKWINKEEERTYYKNRVNSGIHIMNSEILKLVPNPVKTDLDRDILKKIIDTNRLYAYDTTEYIKDMGTPDRYYQVAEDIKNGKVLQKNLQNKQKAVFIDRDGTINKYKGFLTDIKDFELIDGVGEAIKTINNSGYLAIVITNQPVIARGEVTFDELNEIHNKMETLLGEKGAYLDGIYYCPHHPDSGFEGEVKELKIKCRCRKPDTLLVEQAIKDFNIDLSESYFIGDSKNDKETAEKLGIPCIMVSEEYGMDKAVEEIFKDGNIKRLIK